jgi:hypothetical protein
VSVLVSDFVASVRDRLLDNGNVQTWSDLQLTRWIDVVLAAASNLKRDIYPKIAPVSLLPGSIQTIPLDGLQFLGAYYNVVSGNVVNPGGLELMDRKFPAWRAAASAKDVEDVFTDERSPLVFHVNPPNDGTGQITLLYGATPAIVEIGCVPGSAAVLPVPDNYRKALEDGVVSLALGANTRRNDTGKANFYWGLFERGILGGKAAQAETAPKLGPGEEP